MNRWDRAALGLASAVSVLAVGLMHPRRLPAQAVTRTDLIGTWVNTVWRWNQPDRQYVAEWIWTLRSDSTWTLRARHNGQEDTTDLQWLAGGARSGRWALAGDTLRLMRDSLSSGTKSPWIDRGVVARQGDRLVWAWGGRTIACADTLRRVDGSTPLPPPDTTPRPITVARTALVGTWVHVDSTVDPVRKTVSMRTDSLTLQADGTYTRQIRSAPGNEPSTSQTGAWGLYPGDVLAPWVGPGLRLILNDGQLTISACQWGTTYQRARP